MFLSDDEFISINTNKSVRKHKNVKHMSLSMSEDSGTNSESSDSESEVIWISKPVTLPNNCNNVPKFQVLTIILFSIVQLNKWDQVVYYHLLFQKIVDKCQG